MHFYTRCNFYPWKFRLCRILNLKKTEEGRTEREREREGVGRRKWARGTGNETYAPSGVEVQARYTVYAEIFIDLGCGNYGPQNEAVLVCIPGHAGNLSVRMNAPSLLCGHRSTSFPRVPGLKKEPRKVCTLSSSSVCLWKTGEFSRTKEYCGASCIWQEVWWERERERVRVVSRGGGWWNNDDSYWHGKLSGMEFI